MNPKVKELFKSVHICQSYRKNKSGTFLWPTVYIGQLAAVGHKYADDTYSHLIIRILFLKYLKFMKAVRWIFSPNSGNRKKSQKIVKRTSQ